MLIELTPSSPAQMSSRQVLAKFGSKPSEMMAFLSPNRTQQLVRIYNIRTVKDAYLKDSISLAKLRKVYGGESIRMLLAVWINNLVEFAGCGINQSEEAFFEVAELAYMECYYLGISELALFFNRAKAGQYGSFYGRFDPIRLLEWLGQYLDERKLAVDQVRRDEERRRRLDTKQSLAAITRADPAYFSLSRTRGKQVGALMSQMLPAPHKTDEEQPK